MDNLDKLRDKVNKDPNSTLFVPLAEEYRKQGELDEAIEVLKSGIERQPGYMSARVALGKIYLEKDLREEARDEFKKVVDTIPYNLFAHRKLADIYMELGEQENAVKQFRSVIALNPTDEEAQKKLSDLQEAPPAAAEVPTVEESVEAEEFILSLAEEEGGKPAGQLNGGTEKLVNEDETVKIELPDEEAFELGGAEDLEDYAGAEQREFDLGGVMEEPDAEGAEDVALVEPGADEALSVESDFLDDYNGQADESLAVEPEGETGEPEPGVVEIDDAELDEPEPGVVEFDDAALDELDQGEESNTHVGSDFFDEYTSSGDSQPQEGAKEAAISREEAAMRAESILEETKERHGRTISPSPEDVELNARVTAAAVRQEEPLPTLQDADVLIAQEDYPGAMEVYRRLLLDDPEDKVAMQKVHELKALLKLMGKEHEIYVSRLEAFLSAIKNRA